MKKRIQYIIIIYLILIFIKNSIGVENIAQNNSPEFNISILLFKKILYDPAGSDNLFEEFLVSKNIKSYKIKELMPEYSKYFEDNTNTSTNTTHNNEVSTKINSYYEPVKINSKYYNLSNEIKDRSKNIIYFCRNNCSNTFNWNLVNSEDEIQLIYHIRIENIIINNILSNIKLIFEHKLNYIGNFEEIKISNEQLFNNITNKINDSLIEIFELINNKNYKLNNNSKIIKNYMIYQYNTSIENFYNYSINFTFEFEQIKLYNQSSTINTTDENNNSQNNSILTNQTSYNNSNCFNNSTNTNSSVNNNCSEEIDLDFNNNTNNIQENLSINDSTSNNNQSNRINNTNSTNNNNINQNITEQNISYEQNNCIDFEWNTNDLKYSYIGFYIKNNCTNFNYLNINYSITSEFKTLNNYVLVNLNESKSSKKYYRIDNIKEPISVNINIFNKTYKKIYFPKKEKEIKESISINEKIEEPYYFIEIEYHFIYDINKNKKIWVECDDEKKSNYEYLEIKEAKSKLRIVTYKNIFEKLYDNCLLIIQEENKKEKYNLEKIIKYLEENIYENIDEEIDENKIDELNDDSINNNNNNFKIIPEKIKNENENQSITNKTNNKNENNSNKLKENLIKNNIVKREINNSQIQFIINNSEDEQNINTNSYNLTQIINETKTKSIQNSSILKNLENKKINNQSIIEKLQEIIDNIIFNLKLTIF